MTRHNKRIPQFNMHHYKKQTAYTMVELIIVTSLSIFISSSAWQLFAQIKNQYDYQQTLLELQEDAKIATMILRQSISNAGFYGINKLRNYESVIQSKSLSQARLSQAIEILKSEEESNNDELILRYASASFHNITKNAINSINILESNTSASLRNENMAVVLDDGRTLQLTKIVSHHDKSRLLLEESITDRLKFPAILRSFHIKKYYIQITNRKGQNNHPIYALYEKELTASKPQALEVLDGISKMRVYYGVKQNNKIKFSKMPIKNQPPVIIKIKFLLESQQAFSQALKTYIFDGHNYINDTKHLYLPWEICIGTSNTL